VRLSIDDLPAPSSEWEETEPKTSGKNGRSSGGALGRAQALAARLAPSVEGHSGDQALFIAANELSTVLGEDAGSILSVLTEVFNPRCAPPWALSKLKREARRAADKAGAPERKAGVRMAARRELARSEAFDVPSDGGDCMALDTKRDGSPRECQGNISMVLESVLGERVRFEECSGRVVCEGVDPSLGHLPDGEWSDVHTSSIVELCGRMRLHVAPGMVDRAVVLHATKRSYNLLRDGLEAMALAWDGSPRVDDALRDYWGAEDSESVRGVSRVWLLSLAARGLAPGEKVDTCPILIGVEGIRKSTSFEALVGENFFSDSPLPIGDKDALQNIQGKWLWEFQEGSSMRSRDADTVRGFLSARRDRFRASFGRHSVDVERSCTFVATSNRLEVLDSPHGNRRLLPVLVTSVDIEGIKRDRQQILGEAAARVLEGEQHWPTEAENEAMQAMREKCAQPDMWEELIYEWLKKREKGNLKSFTNAELFDSVGGAIQMLEAQVGRREQMRAGKILTDLGYHRIRKWGKESRGSWKWAARPE